MTPRFFQMLAVGLVAALVVYIAVAAVSGYAEAMRAVGLISTADWAVLLGLSGVHFALRFLRWQGYLAALGHRVPAGWSALSYLSGFALTTTPGKIGETWRAVYLRPHGVPVIHTMAAFFVERYTDLLAVIALSLLAAGLYTGDATPIAVGCGVVLAGLLVMRNPGLPAWLERRAAQRPVPDPEPARWRARAAEGMAALATLLRASARLLRLPVLTGATLLALVAWGVQGVVLSVTLDLMGHEIALATAVGIYALGILAGALSFIPGGLGSTEAVLILLLLVAGLDTPDAAAATLICRVATLWFAVLLGILATGWIEIRQQVRRPRRRAVPQDGSGPSG